MQVHKNKVEVRRATASDISWIVKCARKFLGNIDVIPFHEEHITKLVTTYVSQHVVLLAVRDKERLGLIGGSLAAHPYNPDFLLLLENMWWVEPEHRGTRAGALLFDAFDKAGEVYGVDLVVMTTTDTSEVNPDALTRRGYKLKELSYARQLSTSPQEQ